MALKLDYTWYKFRYYSCYGRTEGDSRGISVFVVDRNNPGVKSGKKENKLGMRASETSEIIFNNCEIDQSSLIGQEGQGFIQAMKVLDGGRHLSQH